MDAPTPATEAVYRFGPFTVFVNRGELRKSDERVKLQGQPFQILVMLLRARGDIVTREALRAALWTSDTFVDFEHSLNTAVKKLRQALEDDADEPRYIETVPRVGYRFVHEEGPMVTAIVLEPEVRPKLSSRYLPALVLLAAVLAGALFYLERPHPLRITGTRQLTFHGSAWGALSLDSDGKRVYYFKNTDSNLFSVPVAGGEETSFPTHFIFPVVLHISPDGSILLVKEASSASGYSNRVWMMPTGGGAPRPLGDVQADMSAAFSPDGKTIAYGYGKQIFFTTDDGVTSAPVIDTSDIVSWLRFTPDGKRIRFTVTDFHTNRTSNWEAAPHEKPRPIALNLAQPGDPCCGFWTRDGEYFVFQNASDERVDYWTAEERSLGTTQPMQLASAGEIIFAASNPVANEVFVITHESTSQSFRYDATHDVVTPLLPERGVEDPAFSPDGQWLVYGEQHTESSRLIRTRADGSEAAPLTDPKMYSRFPHFSPDGKRIAFMGKKLNEPWHIYWMPLEGGVPHELKVPVVSQADANWMPDGQTILFGQTPWYMADLNAPRAIYLHNLETGSLEKIPNSDGWFSPRLSPDGRSFLALSTDETKLASYDFASHTWKQLVHEADQQVGAPFWSKDGSEVYYNVHHISDASQKNGAVMKIRLRDGAKSSVVEFKKFFHGPACNAWVQAPDGATLITCWQPNANIYALQYE